MDGVEIATGAPAQVAQQVDARLAVAERACAEAWASSRAKDEFLAMLGHELRNSLSAVRNSLASARLDSKRSEWAMDVAWRQTGQLDRLIDDLLDTARLVQGRVRLDKQCVPLLEIIEHAVEATRFLVEERGHTLSVSPPVDRVCVDGDPMRLEQIVVNLVSNAAKYTERGGCIELLVEGRGAEAVLRVRDSGMGIAPEMLPHIFELFFQGERTLEHGQGGLGIGLAVVQGLVALHDGRVEARSEGRGKGAEFVVRLPAVATAASGAVALSRPSREGTPVNGRRRVLVVEDDPDAGESLMMLLKVFGHQVRVARDGPTAFQLACADAPEWMLVDIGLPGMDGCELARLARRTRELRDVVLVAFTGCGSAEDRQRTLAAGFDHHLTKPVDPSALRALLARREGAARRRAEGAWAVKDGSSEEGSGAANPRV